MGHRINLTRLRSSIDTDVVEEPICLRKVIRVVLHIIVATRGTSAGLGEGGTSPVAAKGGVKYNLIVFEVTRGAGRVGQLEACVRLAPGVWLRRLVVNILGNLVAREEERANILTRDPFRRVDTTFACVEVGPHGRTGTVDATSLVGVLVGSVYRAVRGRRPAVGRYGPIAGERRRIFIGLTAAIAGVECSQADILVVHVLNDVDLAVIGPIWANHPERWPKTATAGETSCRSWHMFGIDDDEVVAVEGFVGGNSNRIPAARPIGHNVLVVYAHVDLLVVIPKSNQLVVECRTLIHVVNITYEKYTIFEK